MKIKLGRQRFWLDPWRFEIWPEILCKLPADMQANSAVDLAKNYLSAKMDDSNRLTKNEELYGLFGGNRVKSDGSFKINGINFISKGRLSSAARQLVDVYQNGEERDWLILLGEQILKYSPRIRSFIIPMLNENDLEFEKTWFASRYKKSILQYDEEIYYPFYDKKDKKNLNNLLKSLGSKALGPWWLAEIESPENIDDLEWRGVIGNNPSFSGIEQLRNPLELFLYIDWIKKDDKKTYYLNYNQFRKDISSELWEELTGKKRINENDELDILKKLVAENKDYRGFFAVHQIGKKLYKKLDIEEDMDSWIEKYFKTMIANNKIRIVDHQTGQPRHGKGLYGKREYQLLKMDFLQ